MRRRQGDLGGRGEGEREEGGRGVPSHAPFFVWRRSNKDERQNCVGTTVWGVFRHSSCRRHPSSPLYRTFVIAATAAPLPLDLCTQTLCCCAGRTYSRPSTRPTWRSGCWRGGRRRRSSNARPSPSSRPSVGRASPRSWRACSPTWAYRTNLWPTTRLEEEGGYRVQRTAQHMALAHPGWL